MKSSGSVRLAEHHSGQYPCKTWRRFEHFEALKTGACGEGSTGIHLGAWALPLDSCHEWYLIALDFWCTEELTGSWQEHLLTIWVSTTGCESLASIGSRVRRKRNLRISGLGSSIKAIFFGALMLAVVLSFWAVISVELLHPTTSALSTLGKSWRGVNSSTAPKFRRSLGKDTLFLTEPNRVQNFPATWSLLRVQWGSLLSGILPEHVSLAGMISTRKGDHHFFLPVASENTMSTI